jgi:hypothetical protein
VADTNGFYDAGDQAAVDNQAKEAKRREADDTETVRIWMSHPNGRDLLYRTLEECHIFDECRGRDALETYFNLGERNIGNRLLQRMQRHPELYMKMMAEQEIERQGRAARLKKQEEKKAERDGISYDDPPIE